MLRLPDLADRVSYTMKGQLSRDGKLHGAGFSSNDNLLVGRRFGTVELWDLQTREKLPPLQVGDPDVDPDWGLTALPIAVDAQHDLLAVTAPHHNVEIWNAESRQRETLLEVNGYGETRDLAFNSTSTLLAVNTDPLTIEIWNIRKKLLRKEIKVPRKDKVWGFTSDGYLMTTVDDSTINFWDVGHGQLSESLNLDSPLDIYTDINISTAYLPGLGSLPRELALAADRWAASLCSARSANRSLAEVCQGL